VAVIKRSPIAVVGGGPAGALAAHLLASGGRSVLLFDEKLAWEKPCGGGLTHKALTQYPFLTEARSDSRFIRHCELTSPSGRSVSFELRHPLAIFSRFALNGLMLDRARSAGVDLRKERVTGISRLNGAWRLTTATAEYSAQQVVLAGGARNSFRAQFASAISPEDLMVTAGYFIPHESSVVQIQFLSGLSGYIWVFPRPGHLSAGIAAKMGETTTADLRRRLEQWLAHKGFSIQGATFYSHILPAFRSKTLQQMTVTGHDWMMIGDSAGLVDPITGEGLYYALRSAELCAQAILAEDHSQYEKRLEAEIVSELKLAARVSQHFYNGSIFGESVLERMITLTQQSQSIRDLMGDLFAGMQSYRGLQKRLLRAAPGLVLGGLSGSIGLARKSDAPVQT
jgi:flavin-dependent dehydrogenase